MYVELNALNYAVLCVLRCHVGVIYRLWPYDKPVLTTIETVLLVRVKC